MDLKKIPFWGQFAIVAAMSLALVAVAWYAYPNFGQMAKKNASDQARLAGLQEEIRKGQAIEAKLPEFEREIENLEIKLSDLLAILPTEPETGELLKWVKNLADQSNLELKQFNPGGLRAKEFYKEFPIKMDVVGGYHDLGVFFDRVSKYSRIINVGGVSINGASGRRGSIRAKFTATTFVYDEKRGEKP